MTGGVEIDLSFLDPHLGSVDIFLFFIFKPISCNSTNVSLEWGFSFGGGGTLKRMSCNSTHFAMKLREMYSFKLISCNSMYFALPCSFAET